MIDRELIYKSILKIFTNVIILTSYWHSGLLWPSRSNVQLELLRNINFKGINERDLVFN